MKFMDLFTPAKGVGRESVARVQIPRSPPKKTWIFRVFSFFVFPKVHPETYGFRGVFLQCFQVMLTEFEDMAQLTHVIGYLSGFQ